MSMNDSADSAIYPMRINKYLAHQGVATRRAADELVTRKKIRINGRIAVLGDMVQKNDRVELIGSPDRKKLLYFAYNKPIGVITHSPQGNEKDIKQQTVSTAELKDVFPIGRLDKDSHGLIILTNDGRVTERLLHPRFDHEKEYRVQTLKPLREGFKAAMEAGVEIEGYRTRPCKIRKTGENTFHITLTEGKKHQIRRMVVALHNQVVDLERVRVMNIKLGAIKPGEWRRIEGAELETFLSSIGLSATRSKK